MIWPSDYHMHTPLCRHAAGEPADYAAQALAIGLREIGFSDHSPMRTEFDDWRMRFDQLGEYVENVQRAQKDFPQMQIKLALEIDYLPGCEDWVRELAGLHPWDYFIGSVHYISESWVVDNPGEISKWKGRDPFEIWTTYFERLAMAAQSGLFEIIGHADLPKKFGIYPQQDCRALFQGFLQAAQSRGVAIELNTAGLRKECKEIYPGRAFLELAVEHQIPITFGSDAHAAREVGMNFAEAVRLARESGYTHYCRFHRRKRSMAAL